MGRGATRAGPLGVAGTALLCVAALVTVLSAPHLIRMLGEYRNVINLSWWHSHRQGA